MDLTWDGRIRLQALPEQEVQVRQALATAAKAYDWLRVIKVLSNHPHLVNTTRPDGSSLYAPLHQAAHGGAPTTIIARLVEMGAWRTLQNSRGERPVDVAEQRGHTHLLSILAPQMKRHVPWGILLQLQRHTHTLIHERAPEYVKQYDLRLPELEPLLEFDRLPYWFEVSGMYGGFSLNLDTDGAKAKLTAESWCRVVEGSGQRHEVTSAGYKLVAEGFV